MLSDLNTDALLAIFSQLDPRSLATTCCVCRRFEHVASSPELWEPLAQLRWSHLHPNLYPAHPSSTGFSAERRRKDKLVVERIPVDGVQNVSVSEAPTPIIQHSEDSTRVCQPETVTACDTDWRALYAGSNGWRRLPQEEEAGRGAGAYSGPRLGQRCLPMAADCEFVSALDSCGLMELQLNHGASEFDAVLIATSHSIEAWNPGGKMDGVELLGRANLPPQELIYCLAPLGEGRLAAGSRTGDIGVYQLVAPGEDDAKQPYIAQNPQRGSPVVDIIVAGSHLLALHDGTFVSAGNAASRNVVQVWDPTAQVEIAAAHDFMESYEIVCFASTEPEKGANEIIAGAVHGGFCGRCFDSGFPSLCCHKSTAHSAALCIFDARAGITMVARFGLPHRSMYPVLRTARSNYIFCSHVGQPLSVWDKRRMSSAVFEEEHLGNFPHAINCKAMPFGAPKRPAEHQALFLGLDGDSLIGRAENGMTWLWDLSSTLGWAHDSGTPGSWLRHHNRRCPYPEDAHWMLGADNQSKRFTDWPTPLGALPCEGSLPVTHLLNNQTGCQLLALTTEKVALQPSSSDEHGSCRDDTYNQESVLCAWLER